MINLKLLIVIAVSFFASTVALAEKFSLTCPSPSTIKITTNTDPYYSDPYAWIGPNVKNFYTITAPQQGNQILGDLTGTKVDHAKNSDNYNLLCMYPSNATTTRISLPPNTGYVGYRVLSWTNGYCIATKDGFICGFNTDAKAVKTNSPKPIDHQAKL
jgi:hypothetical protein